MFSCIMNLLDLIFLLILLCILTPGTRAESTEPFYTAAVFEHARLGKLGDNPKVEANLAVYQKAAEVAKLKGADIIVYPEYGIFAVFDRKKQKEVLESIPDPRSVRTNPCIESETYQQRPILHALSCMARNNSIVLVANTGDIQNCEGEADCPPDGVFHYNTNVVFDRDGTLLVRYHKEHLFFELGMDLPNEQQNSTFHTDFGTFATYICFDIIYERMSQVAQWPNVDGIAFSSQWWDKPPQLKATQFWQSWALGNNATLLAANIQLPGYFAEGSGIFHRAVGALGYTYNIDGLSKLVVAKVPKGNYQGFEPNASITAITSTEFWDVKEDGQDVPEKCIQEYPDNTTDPYTEYFCHPENLKNYTLVKLTNPRGHIEACDNGVCCSLQYSTNNLTENFYLGVYNGSYNAFDRYFWCDESCVLARCDGPEDNPCSIHPVRSETLFQYVHLSGTFSTEFVYPSVLESGVRLTPLTDWHHKLFPGPSYKAIVHYENDPGRKLIAVGLKGRCYSRDPPFVR